MRKVKKINGYLVVRFNEREKEENPGLGSYGVIDAEVYTGDLDFDRSEMEYDDADSLEVAVEQARGLDAERDIDDAATRSRTGTSRSTWDGSPGRRRRPPRPSAWSGRPSSTSRTGPGP